MTFTDLAPVADPDKATTAQLDRSEAVQLFVQRARRVQPNFVADDRNAAAVAEICCRLEGIPLALELAAARIRVLEPAQIAAGLDEVFRLLTGGGRTAVPRHRTLRGSVDWSHALLTEPERVLFRRLAPFAGGFDLDAAEAVGAGPGLATHQVLDQLTLLVDKSLVDRQDGAGHAGTARFRLLETMRQYAAEHLTASGEEAETRRRHRDHYLHLAEALSPLAFAPGQDHALDQQTGEAFEDLLQICTAEAPITLCHGDFRLDNMFFGSGPDPEVALVDWQLIDRGPAVQDLAMFLTQSTDVETRRLHEHDLVTAWHERLSEVAGAAAADYPRALAWEHYRRMSLFTLIIPVLVGGSMDVGNERGQALVEGLAIRSFAAAEDLGAAEFLP